jgi:hypothetical protein
VNIVNMKSGGPALKIHNCRGVPALKIALQDPVPTSDDNLLLLGRCFDRGFEGLAISGYLHILIMVRGFLRSRGRIKTMTLAITCRRFSPSLGPET